MRRFFYFSEYPVVLVAEQIQNKTDKQKSNKVLSLTLLQNLDDSGDNELTYLELVNIHIAPFSVSVDRALARSIITWANPILLLLDANETEDETNGNGKSIQKRKRACIAYMESTVVSISIPPLSFKPVSLSLSRSPLF